MKLVRTRHGRVAVTLAMMVGAVGAVGLSSAPAFAANQSQACVNTLTPDVFTLDADITGTSPASVAPGASVPLTNLNMTAALPGGLFVAGYNAGLLSNGQMINGTAKVVIRGANTTEGTQTTNTVAVQIGPLVVTDPDGTPGTGDEVAQAASFTTTFANQTWTSDGNGSVTFRQESTPNLSAGSLNVTANVGFNVGFKCSPGTVGGTPPAATLNPSAATISTTNVAVPAAAPVANNDTASVGANQATSINVVANDTDANNNLAPGTVAIVTGPTAGTAVANPDGTVTYTNNAAANSDSFTYTVQDAGGLTSNAATVNINILSGSCDASNAACSLDQVISVQVNGAAMSMQQAGSAINLSPITLNGQPQTATGLINGLKVINARGTDAGWSLTGRMTSDFSDGTGDGVCAANDPSTWDNHCIPGGNVGWVPSASVGHTQIPGDVATVNAGAPSSPADPGSLLGSSQTLCSAPATHSGGTFNCGGGIGLGVPASAAAGLYKATLTLTLV